MKMKAMGDMAKKYRSLCLLDTLNKTGKVVRQHVMIGGAVFPLDGMSEIDEKTLLTILEVPPEEHENWDVKREQLDDFMRELVSDNTPQDEEAHALETRIEYKGVKLIPIETPKGVVFLQAGMLRVIADTREGMQLFSRVVYDTNFVVAKRGYMCIAAFGPYKGWVDEQALTELLQVSNAARMIGSQKKGEKA